MSTDVKLALCIRDARKAIEALGEATIEDRARVAMVASRANWMAPSDDDAYAGALEALYATASEDEQERIEDELRALRDLNALLSGAPLDLERMHKAENPIGLAKIWRSVALDGEGTKP